MARPYATTRSGSMQWLMQRVSAVLLIGLAFVHFFLQHFTTDAVSTGITVAARMNDPYWQAYYVMFVVLALYHGVNGVVGILRDYNPRPLLRLVTEVVLWTLAAYYGGLGIKNLVSPQPLGAIKELYAIQGFAVGASSGNPPVPGGSKAYDFREELRELHLLGHYLERHTARDEATPLAAIFDPQGRPLTDGDAVAGVPLAGESFDRWALARIAAGAPPPEARERHATFSSTYEFAMWAANVRKANAQGRLRAAPEADPAAGRAVLDRLASVPAYSAIAHH